MGQLEDLQRNRLARMQHIQKGFCGDDTEGDIVKAHNVGDVHPNHPDWVWTQLPNGKYDWRVRKGQAKAAPAPTPKQPSGEPDFTPKYPAAFDGLTNRSGYKAFDAAYDAIGADLFAEKYPTQAEQQKAVADSIYTKEQLIRRMGREYAGDIAYRSSDVESKTAQIANMKRYYEYKADKAKEAHQKAKNEAYWAGEGAQRKAEIDKEWKEQGEAMKKAKADAAADIQKLFGVNTGYVLNVQLGDYGDYKLGISTDDKRTWDSITLDVRRDLFSKSNDFKTELRYSSMTCDCRKPDEVKQVQNLFHCGNLIMQNTDKIKGILIKYGATYAAASKRMGELVAELKKNH